MATDFRKFIGYTVDELEELWPEFLEDDRFASISFRPNDIQTVYLSKDPKCRRYIAIEYWDGQIVMSDGETLQEVNLSDLYSYLSKPSLCYRRREEKL